MEDHLKELNSVLGKRDKRIEELLLRIRELETGEIFPQEKEKSRVEDPSGMNREMLIIENRDLRIEIDSYYQKETHLHIKIEELQKTNRDLKEVLNPIKKEKNRFYEKYFELEKQKEILENKLSSLLEDNSNLKRMLVDKDDGTTFLFNLSI